MDRYIARNRYNGVEIKDTLTGYAIQVPSAPQLLPLLNQLSNEIGSLRERLNSAVGLSFIPGGQPTAPQPPVQVPLPPPPQEFQVDRMESMIVSLIATRESLNSYEFQFLMDIPKYIRDENVTKRQRKFLMELFHKYCVQNG